MEVKFDATDSFNNFPLPLSARQGISNSDEFVTRVSESIDMLRCTFNGKQRMYALNTKQGIGNCKLHRIDNHKNAILELFYHDGKARDYDYYKLKTSAILCLKSANDKLDMLIDKLIKRQGEKLCEKLQQAGYEETTR